MARGWLIDRRGPNTNFKSAIEKLNYRRVTPGNKLYISKFVICGLNTEIIFLWFVKTQLSLRIIIVRIIWLHLTRTVAAVYSSMST